MCTFTDVFNEGYIKKIKIMLSGKEIRNIAKDLGEKEINNLLNSWSDKHVKYFNILVRLGDSRAIACATVISDRIEEQRTKGGDEMYRLAYYS